MKGSQNMKLNRKLFTGKLKASLGCMLEWKGHVVSRPVDKPTRHSLDFSSILQATNSVGSFERRRRNTKLRENPYK